MKKIVSFLLLFAASCAMGQSLFTTACIVSGDFAKCLPQNGIILQPNAGVRFPADPADGTKYVGITAPSSMSGSAYNIVLPDTAPANGTALYYSSGYTWQSIVSNSAFTNYITSIPMKQYTYAASTANIASLSGDPGLVDGVDFSFGGFLLLKNQTTASQNGLWNVDPLGPWTRMTTMPDDTGSALGAIAPVIPGGTTNGSTIWFSTADGGGDVSFVQIPTTNSNAPLTAALDVITTTGGRLTTNAITGTGSSVRATSPTLVTPTLGVASATSAAIAGAAGAGFIDFLLQSSIPATPAASHVILTSRTANTLGILGTGGFRADLSVASITGNRVMTIPNANGTLVTENGSATIGSKTFDISNTYTSVDNAFTLQDDGDNTKQAQFQLSGITTGTTRTLTVPNSSGTLALNPMTAAGDIIYGGASGVETKLVAGSATQLLHSGTTPSWSAASLTADVTGVLPLANGGTNKNATAVNGGLVWTDTDSMEITSAGTSGDWVLSGGAATPTMSSTTSTAKTFSATTDASSSSTGTVIVSGGVGVAKKLYVGTSLNFSDNTKGIVGTTAGDVAGAGYVGEIITASGGSVSLTSGQYSDAASITLTAGCWDLEGVFRFIPAATTVVADLVWGIGTAAGNDSSGLTAAVTLMSTFYPSSYIPRDEIYVRTPTVRINITGNTTYYLKARPDFSVSTMTTNSGYMRATRIR